MRARAWQKADRLYDLFLPNEGVTAVVLRSAGKPGNKLAGQMLPFAKVKIMVGRGRLDHLAGAATLIDYANLRKDVRLLTLAAAAVEIILHDHSHGQKYKEFLLLENIFTLLNDEHLPLDHKMQLVRVFLWKYFSLSGWQPRLDNCYHCGKTTDKQSSQYVPGRGIICSDHNDQMAIAISPALLEWLNFILNNGWTDILDSPINQKLNKEWGQLSKLSYQTVFEQPAKALKLLNYA